MKKSDLDYFNDYQNKNNPPKAVNNMVWVYTRVSTKEQLENFSLDNQKKQIEHYAKSNGFKITKYFGNTYESAKSDFERREFSKMYKEAKSVKEKPFAILVSKLNRLSRTGEGAIAIYNHLTNELGIQVIETINDLRSDNKVSNFQMVGTLLSASKENYSKLESTLPGMKSLIKSGDILGKCPRGYDHYGPRVADYSKIREKQELVINADGEKLRKAWFWKLDRLSDIDIVKKLDVEGLKVSKQFVSNMWRKPFYCGININKIYDKSVEGNWEPLVSVEHYKKIERIIDKNHQGYNQNKHNEIFPLSSKLYCQKCEGKMTHYPNKTKNQNYYKCNSCSGMNINAKKVHKLFENSLSVFQLTQELIPVFKKQLKKTFVLNNKDNYENAKTLNAKLVAIRDKKEVLKERFAYGKIDQELYEQFITKEQKKEAVIISELDNTTLEISNLSEFIKKAIIISANLPVYWRRYNLEIKRKIQNLVFPSNIYLSSSKDKYLTNEISPIFKLISLIPNPYIDIKKGLLTINYKKSLVVAGTGLEPATFGL